ncbi:hypothetical protein BDV32DRAFT_124115 [Aspergillus pseudonomiae]|nr:hypothetical protein BDV32DRAFT_124115 [Aspergillus pseudonomiae]
MWNRELNISDIHSLERSHAFEVLTQITRIEKKPLPTNEALGSSEKLWEKKPNTRVLYATSVELDACFPLVACLCST